MHAPAASAGHLQALSQPRRHRTLVAWSRELGPVFLLRMLWRRIVVITDPALAAALFKRSLPVTKMPEVQSFDAVRPAGCGREALRALGAAERGSPPGSHGPRALGHSMHALMHGWEGAHGAQHRRKQLDMRAGLHARDA